MRTVTIEITADDFMTGLLAAWKSRGFKTVSVREDGFYRSMKASFDELELIADELGLDVKFVVVLDEFHHDSPVIGEAIDAAVQRRFVSLDNPEYVTMRIKFGAEAADRLLDDLPGGANLYKKLADVFIRSEQENLVPSA